MSGLVMNLFWPMECGLKEQHESSEPKTYEAACISYHSVGFYAVEKSFPQTVTAS